MKCSYFFKYARRIFPMNKVFGLILISAVFLTNAGAQQDPEVKLSLNVTSGPGSKTLYFGLDPIATNGRDTLLGESELPPAPPTGVFDVRFTIQHLGFPSTFQGLDKDYRQGDSGSVGAYVHRLKWQLATGQTTINFAWNLPAGVTGTLKDLFGGLFVNVPMSGTGNHTEPSTAFTFTDLEMTITYDGSLPIQLAAFSASVIEGGRVRLDWTTLTETNNYGFEVQKSPSPSTAFETIPNSFIPGHGTTVEPHHYSYIDETSTAGIWYYRLKQMDLDGTAHYSEPAQVEVLTGVGNESGTATGFMLAQNFPNPFNPTTTIAYAIPATQQVRLKVYDLLGKEVADLVDEVQRAGNHVTTWDASGLAGGVYYYRLTSGSAVETRSLVLVK